MLAQQWGSSLALGRSLIDGTATEPQISLMWGCEDDRDELWRREADDARWLGVSLNAGLPDCGAIASDRLPGRL